MMPERLLTIALFVTYCLGLGYTLTAAWRARQRRDPLLMAGVGLAAWIVLGVLLSGLGVPLDWRLILGLALAGPVAGLIRSVRRGGARFSLRPLRFEWQTGAVLAIFLINLWIYTRGAFAYPWLEDDDSWGHAAGMKYVALMKTLRAPAGVFQYINPYPPGYDWVMGLLHQTSPSLVWTLKFFNSLIVALSLVFCYRLVREYSGDRRQALWALAVLSALPCYLSHFIWAHSLVILLFFVALLAVKTFWDDRSFLGPAVTAVCAIFLTQPTQSIKFVILLALVTLAAGWSRRWPGVMMKTTGVLAAAGILAMAWWGPVIADMASGTSTIVLRQGQQISVGAETTGTARELFRPDGGSATMAYRLEHYLFVPMMNYINNPIGVGSVVCALALLGMILFVRRLARTGREQHFWSLVMLAWFVFAFLGLNSKTFHLPVGLFAFRFWMLLAVPIAVFAAEGLLAVQGFFQVRLVRNVVLVALVILIGKTSALYKYVINTSVWSAGICWPVQSEIMTYVQMRWNLAPNTRVFAFQDNLFVIGQDMLAEFWTPAYQQAFADAFALPVEQLYHRLRQQRFAYLVIGARERKQYGDAAVEEKLAQLDADTRFQLVHQNDGSAIFKILQ